MVDRVEFRGPVGPVGLVVERFVLGRYMQQLIETRCEFLKNQAESESH